MKSFFEANGHVIHAVELYVSTLRGYQNAGVLTIARRNSRSAVSHMDRLMEGPFHGFYEKRVKALLSQEEMPLLLGMLFDVSMTLLVARARKEMRSYVAAIIA